MKESKAQKLFGTSFHLYKIYKRQISTHSERINRRQEQNMEQGVDYRQIQGTSCTLKIGDFMACTLKIHQAGKDLVYSGR